MSDIFLPYSEIFHHVQALRAKLGLPLLKDSNSLGARLSKVRSTGTRSHKLYSLEDALRVYTHMHTRHPQPWNRLGTAAEITSRKFMPLATACEAFRVSAYRFNGAIRKLELLAWRHPHTGKLWVHIEQAAYVAQWRSIHCLRRYLSAAQLEHITTTRPCKTCTTKWGEISCAYYVPEFSHIGSRHTSYKLPRRLQTQKTKSTQNQKSKIKNPS